MLIIKNKFGTEVLNYVDIFCKSVSLFGSMFPSNIDKRTF